jgi:hypothetical protein
MRLPKLDVVHGEVVRVQFTTDSLVGRGAQPTAAADPKAALNVINRMRLFIKLTEGGERDFAFDDATVGVREGHKVSVVRAKREGMREPQPIVLHNHGTGQRMEIKAAFADMLRQKGLRARWRALAGAAFMLLVFCVSAAILRPEGGWIGWAFLIGVGGFPLLWGLIGLRDLIVLPRQRKEALEHLRHEIEGRLAPYERAAAPPQPVPPATS